MYHRPPSYSETEGKFWIFVSGKDNEQKIHSLISVGIRLEAKVKSSFSSERKSNYLHNEENKY